MDPLRNNLSAARWFADPSRLAVLFVGYVPTGMRPSLALPGGRLVPLAWTSYSCAGPMLADQQVTIVAAKAEGADPRHPEAIARPGLKGPQQPKGALVQRLVWRLCVQRGRPLPMAQGLEDLDQRRRPGSGDQVPYVGLERAHRDLHAIGIELGGAADLRGIAHAGARGVTLQQRHLRRTKIGAGISSLHGSPLSLLGGRQEPPAAAIVGEPDPADHAVDRVAVLTSVCQPLEGHEAGALRRNEPVGVSVKGAALPGAAEGL